MSPIPDAFKEHAGRHHFTPDAPSAKAAQKKHAGRFHPDFVRHIGAHTFDGKDSKESKDSPKKSKDPKDDGDTGRFVFPAKKGHKSKPRRPAAFSETGIGKFGPSGSGYQRPKQSPGQVGASVGGAVAGLASEKVRPGSTAAGHLMRSTNLPKLAGGMGAGHYTPGTPRNFGSPTLGTSATGAAVHAFRQPAAEGAAAGTLPKLGRAAGAFARGIPRSPGAAVVAGGTLAGAGIGAEVSHHRKQKQQSFNPYLAKGFHPKARPAVVAPVVPEVWDRPSWDMVPLRTVDGIPDNQHGSYTERFG
jgi:hypothetical protein